MLSFLNWIPGFINHGTKQIGGVLSITGIITLIQILTTLPADQQTALHLTPAIILALGGVLTILRGFGNSSNIAAGNTTTTGSKT